MIKITVESERKERKVICVNDSYIGIVEALLEAIEQTSGGKGVERHGAGRDFDKQPIMTIGMATNAHWNVGQVIKKADECLRMDGPRAIHELLGCIVYAASGVDIIKEGGWVPATVPTITGKFDEPVKHESGMLVKRLESIINHEFEEHAIKSDVIDIDDFKKQLTLDMLGFIKKMVVNGVEAYNRLVKSPCQLDADVRLNWVLNVKRKREEDGTVEIRHSIPCDHCGGPACDDGVFDTDDERRKGDSVHCADR